MRAAALLYGACFIALACSGPRDAPTPVDTEIIPSGPGAGPGPGSGGSGEGLGGQTVNGGGGSGGDPSAGGGGPVLFPACGCALTTLDSDNATCVDCVQLAQDEPNDPCFILFDDCLVDPSCLTGLAALGTCNDTPTIECAEGALAGLPNASAERLVAYYGCLCSGCSTCASTIVAGEGGAGVGGAGVGGAGGGVEFVEACVISE